MRTRLQIHLLLGMLATVGGYLLAVSYTTRLSNHQGYFQVAVEDRVTQAPLSRPRHTAVIVVDGLRADAALQLKALELLRPHARCFGMDVGLPSMSRPVYAALSTGLEQDRTGARGNDVTDALAAESVWEVARRAGLRVEAFTGLTWWQELFPLGFDAYKVFPEEASVFPARLGADLTLLHPVAVDETGHRDGADSAPYRAAVAKVDAELTAMLSTLDWQKDLVVFTADHGHRAQGGHGGPAPEVVTVLNCYAGPGVVAAPASLPLAVGGLEPLRVTALAPSLSLLLGLPFPRHLRAGEDDLDRVLSFLDPAALGTSYLTDAAQRVARARQVNARQLATWSDGAITRWSDWYARQQRRQELRAVLAASLLGVLLALRIGRQQGRVERMRSVGFLIGVPLLTLAGFAFLAEGLTADAINRREQFILNALLSSFGGLLVGSLLHWVWARRWELLQHELITLLLGAAGFHLGHGLAFGWPVGFPVPGIAAYFAPFLGSLFLGSCGLFLLAFIGLRLLWARTRPGPGHT